MARISRFALAFLVIASLALVACASKTPLERVIESRSWYTARLNSQFVKETPLELEAQQAPDTEGESGEGTAASADGDEAAVEGEEMPIEVRKDAVLDVIVQHDTASPLDGLTLDISMVEGHCSHDATLSCLEDPLACDPDGTCDVTEIAHWRRWVDTAGLPKANQRPYSIVLEDVAYEEGYGFDVEVRHPVPEADRGEYREFQGL